MRVLSVHNRYQIRGGEDESREAEERLLREHGHTVDVHEESNERVKELGAVRTAVRTIWSKETYDVVRAKLRRDRYDVVHVQNFFPLISPAVHYAAKAEGVPVVQSLRNYRLICPGAIFFRDGKVCEDCMGKRVPLPAIRHKCYRGSLGGSATVTAMVVAHRLMNTWDRAVDQFICLTEFARGKFIEGGFDAARIVVKPNFVLPDPGIGSGGGGYAVMVGRLTEEKGVPTVLRAWETLGSRIPLKIVGDGPLAETVTNAAKTNPAIEYLGRRHAKEAYDIIGGAELLILPSEWYETFGRVAVEAFAKGTPVVASNLGAMAEHVKPGHTGSLFKPGDSSDLISKVMALLDDPTGLSRMRANARAEFDAKYTAAANYVMIKSIYDGVIRRAHAPSAVRAMPLPVMDR
jgi:glycosyltransferase involved in cell wall biosynthesis